MWMLPKYEVTFGSPTVCRVTLSCAGYEEVTELSKILLRSGYGTFTVKHVDELKPDVLEEVDV